MTLDPFDDKIRYKREQIAKLINLTEEQKTIVDLYVLEESTGKRHWEMDPEDQNIYMEWMNGVNILRNKINKFKAMSARQQKAMYNSNTGPQQPNNGNNTPFQAPVQQQQQQPPTNVRTGGPERILRTASGKEIKASERPDLAKLADKPKGGRKGYPRRNR